MLAFVATLLALPFAVYALLLVQRRARCRKTAASLGARHDVRGWLAPGAIVGERFTIEPVKLGKSFRTRVEVAADNLPGTLFLQRDFFCEPPNWSAASVPGANRQRVFFWDLALGGRVLATNALQAKWLAWIDPSVLDASFAAALSSEQIGEIVVADGRVSALCSGIVLDESRLGRVLGLLERVERRASSRAPARAHTAA